MGIVSYRVFVGLSLGCHVRAWCGVLRLPFVSCLLVFVVAGYVPCSECVFWGGSLVVGG